jgi:CheY-like chemotaxis protein
MSVTQQYANTSMPCILVVDDEVAVRDFLGRALPQFGLAVLSASSGNEAVRLYRQYQTISAALLDMQMAGGLDGPQTVRALREVNPALPCCFMTGGSGDYTLTELLALGVSDVFQKPFRNLAVVAAHLTSLASVIPAVG